MKNSRLSYPDLARIVGTGLISTGLGLLLFVFITIAWGDPFTRFTERQAQQRLQKEFSASFGADDSAFLGVKLDPRLTRVAARRHRRSLESGAVAARMRIPKLGMRKYVVKGADTADLDKGPGIYRETGFPGSGLPVAIAGHRTTHGAPFLNIDKLKAHDLIVLDMPYGRFQYEVTRTQIITPTDWSIIDIGAFEPNRRLRRQMLRTNTCAETCEHLVLTACHPKYSAKQRVAVFARLTDVSLRKAAK